MQEAAGRQKRFNTRHHEPIMFIFDVAKIMSSSVFSLATCGTLLIHEEREGLIILSSLKTEHKVHSRYKITHAMATLTRMGQGTIQKMAVIKLANHHNTQQKKTMGQGQM